MGCPDFDCSGAAASAFGELKGDPEMSQRVLDPDITRFRNGWHDQPNSLSPKPPWRRVQPHYAGTVVIATALGIDKWADTHHGKI